MASFALFKHLEKPAMVRTYIIKDDGGKVRLESVARIIAEPYLELKFRPGELPTELIRNGGKVLLSLDTRVGTVSMYAHVDEMINSRMLRVLGTESFEFAQQREYFRVNTAVKVSYRKETLSSRLIEERNTTTVNISANGVLMHVEERFVVGDTYELKFFPSEADVIECTGLVVRLDERIRGGYEAALHIFKIEPEALDRMIALCLSEQRLQLRTKVQVVGF